MPGRPRQFDETAALWAAVKVFWKLGYRATTVQNLVDAMKVERGSIYRTYGNKEQLFRRAVEHYTAHQVGRLPPGVGPVATLQAWFANNLADAGHRELPNGCLVINSAVESPALPRPIQKLVRSHIDQLRGFFRGCVAAGVDRGLLPPVDPDQQAEALLAAILGINVLSRAGAPIAELTRIADAALAFTRPA